MNINKLLICAALAIIIIASAILLPRCNHDCKPISNLNKSYIRDTIVRTIASEPIIITKVKTKIIKLSDTLIKTYPFVARIDTIIKHDTVRVEFEYPANLLSLAVSRRPDTLRVERIIISDTKLRSEEWWVKPLIVAGSFAAGWLSGQIK
jgi:hypothetical protein